MPTAFVLLKNCDFLIRSRSMRKSHRNAKGSFSRTLWYQNRLAGMSSGRSTWVR